VSVAIELCLGRHYYAVLGLYFTVFYVHLCVTSGLLSVNLLLKEYNNYVTVTC